MSKEKIIKLFGGVGNQWPDDAFQWMSAFNERLCAAKLQTP